MKTIRVIDLLNKIANGEEVPKKIRIYFDYLTNEYNTTYKDKDGNYLVDYLCNNLSNLNDEIEIIEDTPKEDKKIEKFKVIKDNTNNLIKLVIDKETKLTISIVEATILDKVNEIIDKVNGENNDN